MIVVIASTVDNRPRVADWPILRSVWAFPWLPVLFSHSVEIPPARAPFLIFDYGGAACITGNSPFKSEHHFSELEWRQKRLVLSCANIFRMFYNYKYTLIYLTPAPFSAARSRPTRGSTDTVIPQRINEAGKPYEEEHNFIKYSGNGNENDSGRVFYKLVAFGETFEFDLQQDHSFVSPAFTVEHAFSETHRIPFAGNLLHCFYRGRVNRDPVSSAVLNICNGLVSVSPAWCRAISVRYA